MQREHESFTQYFFVYISLELSTSGTKGPRGIFKFSLYGTRIVNFTTIFGLTILLSRTFFRKEGTVIGITKPPPTEGVWSALFSNLSKSGLDNYVVKRSKRPLLEEVS